MLKPLSRTSLTLKETSEDEDDTEEGPGFGWTSPDLSSRMINHNSKLDPTNPAKRLYVNFTFAIYFSDMTSFLNGRLILFQHE